ncbi:MAG TPA: Ppx/GppA phosphatase family protein [Caulobacteraceae bacterium]|jgi:exopolyphosphatase/guanosine-5'-triphosphate,3'-diphosphate pyrophosphatase
MSRGQPDSTLADAAVIDVGSNSVRLVMYRLDGRAIWTVFNEKVLAGLGRDLVRSGRLSADGMATAMNALRRFQALIEASRPAQVHAVATAAIRDALDGGAFRRRVEVESGLSLRVLSGAEEARYAALGVIAGAPDADGLAGDLGGASLELTQIADGKAGRGVTLPLGPFSFGSVFDPNKVKNAVNRELKGVSDDFHGRTLNAVGGAWRNLALLHMRLADYPLGIVHQYELSRSEALSVARFVEQQSRGSLERIEGISRRRVDTLPHAAAVLEGLIDGLGVRRVRVSAFGLREGMLFDTMSRGVRRQDPLISGCAALGGRPGPAETLGAALETWLATAFGKLDALFGARDQILLAAACRLADFGAQLHPDHRADLVFEQVLRAPIAGLDHHERVFLACAAFGRHTASSTVPAPRVVSRLLNSERYERARALGAAVRLGCDISGRSPNLLGRARLDFKPEVVSLQVDPGWEAMMLGEAIAKRAATLATILGRELRLKPSPVRAAARRAVG